MKYIVSIGTATVDVDIGRDKVVVGRRTVDARLEALPHGPMSLLVMDDMMIRLAVEPREGGWAVQVDGRVWLVEVLDERSQQIRAMSAKSGTRDAAGIVKAPMPGMVVRWEVDEGQSVTRNTGLVVLEAMKMENEIRALGEGTVRRILVSAGTAVEKGTPLLEIGPAS